MIDYLRKNVLFGLLTLHNHKLRVTLGSYCIGLDHSVRTLYVALLVIGDRGGTCLRSYYRSHQDFRFPGASQRPTQTQR